MGTFAHAQLTRMTDEVLGEREVKNQDTGVIISLALKVEFIHC